MHRSSDLIDPFGRAITYIRVSVTDRCDFRCVYCMAEDMTFLPRRELLTLEELDRLCSAFVEMGTRKIRITGGEPLVRRDIMGLFRSLSRHLEAGTLSSGCKSHPARSLQPEAAGAVMDARPPASQPHKDIDCVRATKLMLGGDQVPGDASRRPYGCGR
jgi:MoaA/NifB/PqqE/SkfB family radical SAM enzyme